jgi:hypothetical protein
MTITEAREYFNAARDAHAANGDHDAAARTELLREYFTNPEFRTALANHLFAGGAA